tara:strand:+ start:195 stop:389 length:195 start_codon:yes stop_codon:yes gene_type:complete
MTDLLFVPLAAGELFDSVLFAFEIIGLIAYYLEVFGLGFTASGTDLLLVPDGLLVRLILLLMKV